MGFHSTHHLHQVLLEPNPNGPSRPEEQSAAAGLFGAACSAAQSLDAPAGEQTFVLINEPLRFFPIYFVVQIPLYGIK
jgi:hypothetical protein